MEEENKTPENEDLEEQKAATEQPDDRKNEPKNELSDEQSKKIICALAYLFGILFFLPLILYSQDEFARYHANQSLVVLIVTVIGEVVFGILCAILPILGILCGLFGLLVLIACIYAIVGVAKGEKRGIPFIEKFHLLK